MLGPGGVGRLSRRTRESARRRRRCGPATAADAGARPQQRGLDRPGLAQRRRCAGRDAVAAKTGRTRLSGECCGAGGGQPECRRLGRLHLRRRLQSDDARIRLLHRGPAARRDVSAVAAGPARTGRQADAVLDGVGLPVGHARPRLVPKHGPRGWAGGVAVDAPAAAVGGRADVR